MSLVFYSADGATTSQLIRTTRLCEAMQSTSCHPSILSMSGYPPYCSEAIPGGDWGALVTLDASAAERRLFAYLQYTSPAMFFEDTNPIAPGTSFPPMVDRILIVEPDTLQNLTELYATFSPVVRRFMLADHPHSPTWPYSISETRQLFALGDWDVLGPVFRDVSVQSINYLKQRYSIGSRQTVYVIVDESPTSFVTGARNQQYFLTRARAAIEQLKTIDPSSRFFLVTTSSSSSLPAWLDPFEVINDKWLTPELLALATGAIVYPSTTLLWQCLHRGTPFIAIADADDSFHLKRLPGLSDALHQSISGEWKWRAESSRSDYQRRARGLTAIWTGTPDLNVLKSAISRTSGRQATARASLRKSSLAEYEGSKGLVIRIDDVTQVDYRLQQVLNACNTRRLPSSLEIIPFLSTLTDKLLDDWDPYSLHEVAQHGYAHIPQVGLDGTVGEFIAELEPLDKYIKANLEAGFNNMKLLHPKRFYGGYSPPYDGLPGWLPSLWKEIGGIYLSIVSPRADLSLPSLITSVDVWHWKHNCFRPRDAILHDVYRSIHQTGYAGLVLHAQPLVDSDEFDSLIKLLDDLLDLGFVGQTSRENVKRLSIKVGGATC